MALSIGVWAGSRIKVGDDTVKVKQIISSTLFVLQVNGGAEITVSDKERVRILPDVYVFAGIGGSGVGSRLAFEAPRSIGIHRVEER